MSDSNLTNQYHHYAIESLIYIELLRLNQTPIKDRMQVGICVIINSNVTSNYVDVLGYKDAVRLNISVSKIIGDTIAYDLGYDNNIFPIDCYDEYHESISRKAIWMNKKRHILLNELIDHFHLNIHLHNNHLQIM